MDFLRLLSRKRMQRLSGTSSTDSGSLSSDSSTIGSVLRSATRHSALPPFEQELHDVVSGRLGPSAPGPDSAAFSSASYAARDPCRDVRILHADSFGLLAAVLTFGAEAQPNGRYLQRNLQHEVLEQAAGTGNAAAAVPAAIAALNTAYRNLHPFNGPVLEGVLVAVAYVDLRGQMLHLSANRGCRVVAGRSVPGGEVVVAAELGREAAPAAAKQQARARDAPAGAEQQAVRAQDILAAAGGSALMVASVPLSEAVDTVVVASEGVWRELPAYKALLRLQHWAAAGAATALRPAGGAAGHLVNAALYAVAARVGRLADPRMRSLRSVSHLASLWAGDRSSYKYRGRQVVRRRRGDVHGDLTVVVLQLGAAAAATAAPAAALPTAAGGVLPAAVGRAAAWKPMKGEAVRARSAARWALLRMHFVIYRRAARAYTYTQWHQVVAGAVAQMKEAAGQRAAAAAESVLRAHATDAVANVARPLAALSPALSEKTRPAEGAMLAAAGRPSRADQENAAEQRLAAAARRPLPPLIVRQNASRNLLAPSRGHGPRLAAGGLGRAGSAPAPAQIPLHMLGLGSVLQAH